MSHSEGATTDQGTNSGTVDEETKMDQKQQQHQDGSSKGPRPTTANIYVNKKVHLEEVELFGFDMDYTLAEYSSPTMERLTFELCIEYLIAHNCYPREIAQFDYDPMFSICGLWVHFKYGNLLKVDESGTIFHAFHGRRLLKCKEIDGYYPNKFVQLSSEIYVLNTLFNLPEANLFARLVDFFDKFGQQTPDRTGVRYGDVTLSYDAIFQDIRNAMDHVHNFSVGELKKKILDRIDEFVKKDKRIDELFIWLRNTGRKTFLLTNSDYGYTKGIMTFLLGTKWRAFFDMVIVDARKPLWFGKGTGLREVDTDTGALKMGTPADPLKEKGAVYSGGSCEVLRRFTGKVLYIGDHTYSDVLSLKKHKGWHTFLVVPELSRELGVWADKRGLFERLQQLESELKKLYSQAERPTEAVTGPLFKRIQEVTQSMEEKYGVFGSLFTSGARTTYFGSQVKKYADLYADSCFNLVNYPAHYYFFSASMALMPHESTVDHGAAIPDNGSRKNMDEGGSDGAGALSHQSTSPATNDSIEEEGDSSGGASSEEHN
ncbi:hypothetical protein niasHT_014590 [Heterodera trifolii]|uniref:Cytosolic purine 5'-nucleotidase n=1 Tax=Heterodera trifolii TaxID=157864 RepID=A0ABD2LI44_9BILA